MSDCVAAQMSFMELIASAQREPPQPKVNPAIVPDEEVNRKAENIPTLKEIIKLTERIGARVGMHEFLSDVFECSAIAISNQVDMYHYDERERRYLAVMKKYKPDEQQIIVQVFTKLFMLLSNQTASNVGFGDYLGELYMQSNTSNSKAGQFFTPYHVSMACAELSIDEKTVQEYIEKDEILTLNEPACGSGGMLIAAADVLYNQHRFNIARNLFVECSDIDSRCVHMSYLQLSLAGIPAVIYKRDTLTMQTWDRWETPAYIMQWLRFRKFG